MLLRRIQTKDVHWLRSVLDDIDLPSPFLVLYYQDINKGHSSKHALNTAREYKQEIRKDIPLFYFTPKGWKEYGKKATKILDQDHITYFVITKDSREITPSEILYQDSYQVAVRPQGLLRKAM